MISYSFSHVFKACTSLLGDVLRWLLEFLCQKPTFLSLWCWYLIFFSFSLRFFCFFIYLVIFCWELEDLYFIPWDSVFSIFCFSFDFLWHLSSSGMGKVTAEGSACYLLMGLNWPGSLLSAFWHHLPEYGDTLLHPGSVEITVLFHGVRLDSRLYFLQVHGPGKIG